MHMPCNRWCSGAVRYKLSVRQKHEQTFCNSVQSTSRGKGISNRSMVDICNKGDDIALSQLIDTPLIAAVVLSVHQSLQKMAPCCNLSKATALVHFTYARLVKRNIL